MAVNITNLVCNDIEPLDGSVWVEQLEHGTRKIGQVLLKDDEKLKMQAIHARWCKVYKKHSSVNFLEVGDWILVKHGYWSRSVNIKINGEMKELWVLPKDSVKNAILAKRHEN